MQEQQEVVPRLDDAPLLELSAAPPSSASAPPHEDDALAIRLRAELAAAERTILDLQGQKSFFETHASTATASGQELQQDNARLTVDLEQTQSTTRAEMSRLRADKVPEVRELTKERDDWRVQFEVGSAMRKRAGEEELNRKAGELPELSLRVAKLEFAREDHDGSMRRLQQLQQGLEVELEANLRMRTEQFERGVRLRTRLETTVA